MPAERTIPTERAIYAERTSQEERATEIERTKKAERARACERTMAEERTWFDAWQAKRLASRANRRQFQLLKLGEKLSQIRRENQIR
jgi:hypothetical protein